MYTCRTGVWLKRNLIMFINTCDTIFNGQQK